MNHIPSLNLRYGCHDILLGTYSKLQERYGGYFRLIDYKQNNFIHMTFFKEYINEMRLKNINIDESNWDFVTGKKEEIYDVAKSYFVNVSADSLAPGGFLHSEYFVLVDKEGRIRSGIDKNGNVVGVYDGTNEVQLRDLINDVKVLMAEYKRPKKNK